VQATVKYKDKKEEKILTGRENNLGIF